MLYTQAASVFTVYMSTTGSSANSGLTSDKPVRTLSQAQQVIQKAAPKSNVEVRIQPGTYTEQGVNWTHFISGRTISFLPTGYNYGKADQVPQRPKFVGMGKGVLLSAVRKDGGGDTNLRFYYLEIQDYLHYGISISGTEGKKGTLRRPLNKGANNNVFYGMYFNKIGDKATGSSSDDVGYGAIGFVNSSNNSVKNNTFSNLINTGSDAKYIHAVYMAHGSNDNVISANKFMNISGDPIKVRNDSNSTTLSDNIFTRTGIDSAYRDSFQSGSVATKLGEECSSHGARIFGNTMTKTYKGGFLHVFSFAQRPGEQRYAGKDPKCSVGGQDRVKTWSNKN